jgi:nucleotide-binding universal stress UspA family protein
MSLPRNILVAVDLGEHTKAVLDYAAELIAKLGARAHVLHSVDWPLLGAELPGVSDAAMAEIKERKRQELAGLAAAHPGVLQAGSGMLREGDPRAVIPATAVELDADLIVMGTHGRRGISRWLLGSVAESVARTASCPVLLVRVDRGAGSATSSSQHPKPLA